MTYHVKLEKKIGIPSQAVDTSEKLPELSKKGLVSNQGHHKWKMGLGLQRTLTYSSLPRNYPGYMAQP